MGYYALIMAGGGGTRLWPLSRRTLPKQALRLVGKRTMFEHAVDRIVPIFQPDEIYVVTTVDQEEPLMLQAPELPHANFLVEPLGRGTAPAIGLGAIHMKRRDPDAVMAVLTADHFIRDVDTFRRVLRAAVQVAEEGHLVTLGITPTFPSTGYGYIKQGEPLREVDGFTVYRAERFTEKPSAETAFMMVESGDYSWNSGMFIWRVDRILEEFARQMPGFYNQLIQVEAVLGTPAYQQTLERVWPQVAPQTIDYGIMEGAEDVVVIPVDIGWSDVGNWSSMRDILPADEDGNVVVGDHLGVDTRNTIVFGRGRLIATIGLENMIVVDTEDALLICPIEREQEVREVVRRLEEEGRKDLL
ncbi:MAG TPA: NTP transferase domain-containing protein [Thermoflexia bacterium]|jgi:mannose-1-phosphate guanylyltransferase|nr:NTP transferase domain-containing protein [Thermoflexia bacterium]